MEETRMPRFGDAKSEFRGTTVRDDAALSAWLAKRTETALEPDLPIIDPHHHFWDTPQRGRCRLPELLADIGGGHNIVSTVFLECRAMYRKSGPPEMAALGEVEFVTGIAAMSASGGYGACRVAEGIVGGGDLSIGARGREVLLAGWRKDILGIAKSPNVYCKLGGLGMVSVGFDFHERDTPPSSEELAGAW